MFSDDLGGRVVGGKDIVPTGFLDFRLQRAFPFDPVDKHGGEDAVPLVVEHLRGVGIQQLLLAAMSEEISAPP